jgi:hypothetical protein
MRKCASPFSERLRWLGSLLGIVASYWRSALVGALSFDADGNTERNNSASCADASAIN